MAPDVGNSQWKVLGLTHPQTVGPRIMPPKSSPKTAGRRSLLIN